MIAAAEEQLLMEVSNSPKICHLIELKKNEENQRRKVSSILYVAIHDPSPIGILTSSPAFPDYHIFPQFLETFKRGKELLTSWGEQYIWGRSKMPMHPISK